MKPDGVRAVRDASAARDCSRRAFAFRRFSSYVVLAMRRRGGEELTIRRIFSGVRTAFAGMFCRREGVVGASMTVFSPLITSKAFEFNVVEK